MLEQIQREGGVSIAELARAHGVSPVTVHRDLEQLRARGWSSGSTAARAGLNGSAGRGAHRRPRGPSGSARRAPRRRRSPRTRPGSSPTARRSSSTRPRPRWRSRGGSPSHPPDELTLVTNSPAIVLRDRLRADPRDRLPGRGRPAHAHDRGPLDHRVPRASSTSTSPSSRPPASRSTPGLTTSRRPLADVLSTRRRRDAERTRRPDRLHQVRARGAAHDHAAPEQLDLLIVNDGVPAATVAQDYAAAGVRLEIVNE